MSNKGNTISHDESYYNRNQLQSIKGKYVEDTLEAYKDRKQSSQVEKSIDKKHVSSIKLLSKTREKLVKKNTTQNKR